MKNAALLRGRIFLALGLGTLGCEHNPEPSSVPPIEMIEPPDGPSGNTLALPAEHRCAPANGMYGPYCREFPACEGALAEMPSDHYAAPFENCRPSANFSAEMTENARASSPSTCCYRQMEVHPMGRPLRDDDVAVVPEIVRAEGDVTISAERFVAIARIEHSSIASFSELSLSLLAHGAPMDLIEGAHRAALDEIAHATAALAIASSLDGVAREFGRMAVPSSDRSFHGLVRSTVVDGCFGEVIGALEAAESCEDGDVGDFFRMVAEEEARHAVLAFRIVRWALSRDRAAAEAAIDDALTAITTVTGADPVRTDAARGVTMPLLGAMLKQAA